MKMNLKIKMERIEFDSEQCSLRVTGRNVEENEFVKVQDFLLLLLPHK
jgi:stalled ribosome rescue protein Dom34